jgi:hypothetical protein
MLFKRKNILSRKRAERRKKRRIAACDKPVLLPEYRDSCSVYLSNNWSHKVKAYLKTAAVALAAYALIAIVQNQFEIPVIGKYLPR